VTQGLPLPAAAVLTHTSNTLPASGIILMAGGTYTVCVSTNLQSWGVRVYEGTNTTPIITRPANPSPAIDRNDAPVASFVQIAIPAGSNRSLSFTIYAAEVGETLIGSVAQSKSNPVLTHSGNTLPASGIIPHTGGTYAIDVTTNLQDWGVKVYEGTNTTPLVTQPAKPSPAIDRSAEPVASTTSFTIPAATADRNLTVMLYAGEVAESSAGSVRQHAYDWGDLTATNRRITWDGSGYSLTADPTDAGLYFKFGSVVGLFSAHHANQTLPGTGTDGFDSGDIAWNPTNASGWSTVPVYAADTDSNTITPESGYHTAANVKVGKGDPCRLVGLNLTKIMTTDAGSLTTADIDNGLWRLPTVAENQSFSGYSSTTNTAAHWLTLIDHNVIGGMFSDSSSGSIGTFLPAAGHRLANSGAVNNQGSYGNYWASAPNISASGYMLSFNRNNVNPMSSNAYTFGFSIRCVRQ
jgi:hypothetical protein